MTLLNYIELNFFITQIYFIKIKFFDEIMLPESIPSLRYITVFPIKSNRSFEIHQLVQLGPPLTYGERPVCRFNIFLASMNQSTFFKRLVPETTTKSNSKLGTLLIQNH